MQFQTLDNNIYIVSANHLNKDDVHFRVKCNEHERLREDHESFEFVVTSDDSFVTAWQGLTAMEEINCVEDYLLLECTAPSAAKALLAMSASQSNDQLFGLEVEGFGRSGIV